MDQSYPVEVRARLDEPLSRWLWLVKSRHGARTPRTGWSAYGNPHGRPSSVSHSYSAIGTLRRARGPIMLSD